MSILHFIENDAFLEDELVTFIVSFHEKIFIKRCINTEFGVFGKVLELHNEFI